MGSQSRNSYAKSRRSFLGVSLPISFSGNHPRSVPPGCRRGVYLEARREPPTFDLPFPSFMADTPSLAETLAISSGKSSKDDISSAVEPVLLSTPPRVIVVQDLPKLAWTAWFQRDMMAFFLFGVVVPLPTIVATSAARIMLVGITGVSGVSYAIPAALASFVTPMFVHHVPYPMRVGFNTAFSVLSLLVCTFGGLVAGPIIGTMLTGAVYGFGSNLYLATAAFYDQRTVIAFSIGTNLSCLLGPALYIPLMKGLDDDWKTTLRILAAVPAIQPIVWWVLLPAIGRADAERTRKAANALERTASDLEKRVDEARTGFGPGRTRLGVFFRVIFPRYVLPLMLCTCGAFFTLEGLVPAFDTLRVFKLSPTGDLFYELNVLLYGSASFLFALIAIKRALPQIWLWAALEWTIAVLGIVQLFAPFLKYFPVWLCFIWAVGGIVGGSTTNTNYKVADDFRRSQDSEDVRAFAMSCAGFGNFAGDAVGGAFAVLVQNLADKRHRG
ncbi:CLN3 protein-domain-containing protein [Amylostereum chailletii]|nr:CLN3 protein-domain-containing protein [Amylostereum chailletii]